MIYQRVILAMLFMYLSFSVVLTQQATGETCSCQQISEDGLATVTLTLPVTSLSKGNQSLVEMAILKQNFQEQAKISNSQGLMLMQLAQKIQKMESKMKDLELAMSKPPADCQDLLVSGDSPIPDSQITASSMYNAGYSSSNSRLLTIDRYTIAGNYGTWAAKTNDKNQWLQFDFGRVRKMTAILTKGRHGKVSQFVRSYQIHYGNNTLLMKGYREETGLLKTFTGNIDVENIEENVLHPPVYARYLRINPITWYEHISMRADVLGC